MNRPLQVYLDSSDFSVLSDPGRQPALASIEHELIGLQSAGLIEIRFSHLHIVETSPTRREDVSHAKARIEKIRQLCGSKCLVSTFSIIDREVSSPGDWLAPSYREWLLRDDGDWLPLDLDVAIPAPHQLIRDALLEQGLNRYARRQRERQYLDKRGQLKHSAKAQFGQVSIETISEIQRQYPLSEESAIRLLKAIGTGADKSIVLTHMRKALRDLAYWPEWYEKQWERVSPVSSFLRDCGKAVREGTTQLSREFQQIYIDAMKEGLSEDDLKRIRDKTITQSIPDAYSRLVNRLSLADGHTRDTQEFSEAWKMRPGMATAAAMYCRIAWRSAVFARLGRSPSTSDLGDVMHCIHLPFVDIFRADSFTASVISEAKLPFPTIIVPKLTQLPEVIRDRLKVVGKDYHRPKIVPRGL